MHDLSEHGQQVYNSLLDGRKVNAAQKALALNAARLAETLDRIERHLADDPRLIVVNSQNTETVNPLISEARMLTSALSQVLAKMGFAELPESVVKEKSPLDEIAERRARRESERFGGSDSKDSAQP